MFRFLPDNLRRAALTCIRNPGFTVVACLLLAAGIGLNTTVFSVVNAVLLRPLPFRDSDRLILAGAKRAESEISYPISPAEFRDWKERATVFEDIAAYASAHPALMIANEPLMVRRTVTTASLFPMLGVRPLLGRTFSAADEEREESLVLLTHGFWVRAFGADPGAVGRTVTLDDRRFTIIGVLPSDLSFFTKTDIWTLVNLPRQTRDRRAVGVIARLRPGVPIESAQAQLDGVAHQLEQSYPNTNRGFTGTVLTPLRNRFVFKVRRSLMLLWASVGMVLLIVCANIGCLQVARSEARYREVAVRASMGASLSHIVAQLVMESMLISLAGGLLGAVFSMWGVRALVNGAVELPRASEIHVDAVSLLFCFAAAGLSAVLCGTIPAWKARGVDLAVALKESGRSSTRGWGLRGVFGGLVVGQTALTLMLVFAAAMLVSSFHKMRNVDPGFRVENLATIDLKLSKDSYRAPYSHAVALNRLTELLSRIPGVVAVGATNSLPLAGQAHNVGFRVSNQPVPSTITVQYRFVTPGYFRAMGIAVAKGRVFSERDDSSSARVCMINQAMARRFWASGDPLASTVQLPERLLPGAPWMQVAGIVADVRQLELTSGAAPEIYIPIAQYPNPGEMTLVARTESRDPSIAAQLRGAIRGFDKSLPLSGVEWMEDIVSRTMASNRFSSDVLTGFAFFALLMAVTGMYSAISFAVSRRTRDLGIRLALGATTGNLRYFVLRLGATLTAIGIAMGLIGAVVLGRFVASFLYDAEPMNPALLIAVVLIVAPPLLLACYWPARRVSSVDPMISLRHE